jgi:hypothetical protein
MIAAAHVVGDVGWAGFWLGAGIAYAGGMIAERMGRWRR